MARPSRPRPHRRARARVVFSAMLKSGTLRGRRINRNTESKAPQTSAGVEGSSGGAEAVRIGAREREFVLAVTRKFLHDPEEAGDATQDALLRAYRKRDRAGELQFITPLDRFRLIVTAEIDPMTTRPSRRVVLRTVVDTVVPPPSH